MNIKGKTMVYKNDYGYSCTISNKKQDESYEYMYVSLQLPKGIELENKTFIEITKGFMTFYKDKNGTAKIKFVVQDFFEINKDDDVEKYNYGDGDLPF